jgi:tRNA-Thr(GGU) m(6)t(6)A37 methyltransferase TsaA
MKTIAYIRSELIEKFGIPRQSGLVEALKSQIIFTPEYRIPDALRGLEDFSHIWLIWKFSKNRQGDWSPTVRPPRLGGNRRLGVFATRSPFRPNALGLSCVQLERVELHTAEGPILHVAGADLMDGTPILDIKPYIPYADCRSQAKGGFTDELEDCTLRVEVPAQWRKLFTERQYEAVVGILKRDPRPHYHHDPNRVYGMTLGTFNIQFKVQDYTAIVCGVEIR